MSNTKRSHPHWVVINTLPHREQLAVGSLRCQDFDAYCPFVRRRRSHARRVDTVLRPLFSSYLFVRVDIQSTHWRPILTTHGVRTIVRVGEDLSFIDDAFIANLKAREIDGAIVRPPTPYQVGQQVQIAAGPFDRVIATIIDMDEKDRLVVLLNMMNRGIKVTIKTEWVTPVSALPRQHPEGH